MQYKKYPQFSRRYLYGPGWGPMAAADRPHDEKQDKGDEENRIETNKTEDIPLPNETEAALDQKDSFHGIRKAQRTSILDFFRQRIHIEEIILLGLIFLLLDEGIEDEFLLLLLLYILLT